MTDLERQMADHRDAITAVRMLSAMLCADAAHQGVFYDTGAKCAWCPHWICDGCSLREK